MDGLFSVLYAKRRIMYRILEKDPILSRNKTRWLLVSIIFCFTKKIEKKSGRQAEFSAQVPTLPGNNIKI
jgi:hypothetical protein